MPCKSRTDALGRSHRTRWNCLRAGIALLGCCAPCVAFAEAYGTLQLTNGQEFAIACVIAVPSAIACGLLEMFGPRRRFPFWLGVTAAIAMIYSVIATAALMKVDPAGAGKPPPDYPMSDWVFNIFTLPGFGTLALVTLMPQRRRRLAAAWVVSLLTIAIFWLIVPTHEPAASGVYSRGEQFSEAQIAVWAGACVCVALFTIVNVCTQIANGGKGDGS